MQSTEEEPRSPETIIHEAETAIWKDSEYFTAEDVFVLAKALAAERDRADQAEAEVTRMQMVRDALTAFEDGEIEHLVAFVREIDRIANNTKDHELSEATA